MSGAVPERAGGASAEAMEAARRYYFGGGIEAGLCRYTDDKERSDPEVRRAIERYAEFGEAYAAQRERAVVERVLETVRDVDEHLCSSDEPGMVVRDIEEAIRAAFPRGDGEQGKE